MSEEAIPFTFIDALKSVGLAVVAVILIFLLDNLKISIWQLIKYILAVIGLIAVASVVILLFAMWLDSDKEIIPQKNAENQ